MIVSLMPDSVTVPRVVWNGKKKHCCGFERHEFSEGLTLRVPALPVGAVVAVVVVVS